MASGHYSIHHKLHGLSKNERLCNHTLVNILFKEGEVFQNFPLRIFWKISDKPLDEVFNKNPICVAPKLDFNNIGIFGARGTSFSRQKIPANARFVSPIQCLIGVSKKNHRHAVVRNHLKRLIREAYRVNKHDLYQMLHNKKKLCLMAILYTGKPQLKYADIEKKIIVSLQKIQVEIQKRDEMAV